MLLLTLNYLGYPEDIIDLGKFKIKSINQSKSGLDPVILSLTPGGGLIGTNLGSVRLAAR